MGHHRRRAQGDAPLIGGLLLVLAAVLLVGGAELVTAVLAAVHDRPGLAVGDALGANVTMLTAALGLAALVRPLPVGRRTRLYAGGTLGRRAGAALLALYGAFVVVTLA